MKDTIICYCLWFFLGMLGVHRFYLNRPVSGIVYLLTGGILGIGWLVDACLIPGMVDEENMKEQSEYMPQSYIPSATPIVVRPKSSYYDIE